MENIFLLGVLLYVLIDRINFENWYGFGDFQLTYQLQIYCSNQYGRDQCFMNKTN